MTNVETYRPKSSLALAAIAFLLIALYIVQIFFYSQNNLLSNSAIAIAVGVLVYILFVKPKVVFFDEGITIVNPLTSNTVSWADVEDLETRFALTVHVRGRRIQAWAAPAPGRYHARTVRSAELKGLDIESGIGIRPGDSPRSHSGITAQIAKSRRANFTGKSSVVSTKTSFDIAAATSLVACIGVYLVASFLHY